MRTEEQCKPSERYLFADTYFTDNAITLWKTESVKRCIDKPKGDAYKRYVDWQRKDNEIAIFTLNAYADIIIPKKFDIIFQTDDPSNFIKLDYELTQSIHEAWFPVDSMNEGHKHLCIFIFDGIVPDILNLLHKENERFSTLPKNKRG